MGLLDFLYSDTARPTSRINRLAGLLADQQAADSRAASVMRRADSPEWITANQLPNQRVGGDALEAPIVSPDDLIGTGIPSKLFGLLATGVKAAAAKEGMLAAVPMAGVIKQIAAPEWNAARKTIPYGEWDKKADIKEVMALLKDKQAISAWNTLRTLQDKATGKIYGWPADAALHDDVGAALRLNPATTVHGLIAP